MEEEEEEKEVEEEERREKEKPFLVDVVLEAFHRMSTAKPNQSKMTDR